jgi:hypothetical protein
MARTINVLKRGEIVAEIKRMKKKGGGVSVLSLAGRTKSSRQTCTAVLAAYEKGEDPATARRCDMDASRKAVTESKLQRTVRQRAVVNLAKQVKTEKGRKTPVYSSAVLIKAGLEKTAKIKVSRATVSRDLKRAGYKAYVRPVHPFDAKASAEKRCAFANQKLLFKPADAPIWKGLIFVDETFLDTNDRTSKTQYVPRGKTQLLVPRVVKNRFNVPHLQIFAAVGYNFKSDIVVVDGKKDDDGKVMRLNADRYVRCCLSKMKTQLQKRGKMLVQDGARCHIAKGVMAYLQRNKINVLPKWPAYSPDLNPIENVWKLLNVALAHRSAGITSVDELKKAVVEAWKSLPQQTINNLVLSFRGRLLKVRATKGACVVSKVKLQKKKARAA